MHRTDLTLSLNKIHSALFTCGNSNVHSNVRSRPIGKLVVSRPRAHAYFLPHSLFFFSFFIRHFSALSEAVRNLQLPFGTCSELLGTFCANVVLATYFYIR